MTLKLKFPLMRRPAVAIQLALTCAGLLGASAAHAFPVLPEARAFLDPQLGHLNCGPASGGFATSCGASGEAVGGTDNSIAILTGPSTASYALGADPSVTVTSDFERVYPPGGGGYVESGATSAELIYEMQYCTDAACSTPTGTSHAVDLTYGISLSETPSSIPDAIPPGYEASLSFGYYGSASLVQATLCNYCTMSNPLAFGVNVLPLTIQDNTLYEVAISVDVNGMGAESFTFDPTFSASDGAGTFVFSPLVGGGSPLVGGGVPEPAAWATMLLGFGFTGLALRRRRTVAPAA